MKIGALLRRDLLRKRLQRVKLQGDSISGHQQKTFVTFISGFWLLREWGGGLSESVKKGKFKIKGKI